ncbi:MAG: glycosyl transferase [Clostridia bacterium]|nr:glycosyl transferase [Clostridia bacterium]
MAIPKIIHYCWFGRGEMPEDYKRYIESWKKYCPDYEIKEWNEDNFDVNCNEYVKQAYEARKFAFVSDYARVCALYTDGGIYMDTDVELLKSLDGFLDNMAFGCFESNNHVSTGFLASQKQGEWIGEIIRLYDGLKFIKEDGSYDVTTNVERITELTVNKYGLVLGNTCQDLGVVKIFTNDYFSTKDWDTGIINKTENSHAVHHFAGSWHSEKEKKEAERYRKKLQKYIDKYGEEKGRIKMLKSESAKFYLTHPHKIFKKLITGKRD